MTGSAVSASAESRGARQSSFDLECGLVHSSSIAGRFFQDGCWKQVRLRQSPPQRCSSRQEALSKDIPALLDRHPWLCILTSGQSRRPAQLRLREVARLREGERSENTGMCSSNNDDNNSKPRMQRHGSIRFSMSSLQDEGSVLSPAESWQKTRAAVAVATQNSRNATKAVLCLPRSDLSVCL